MFLNGYSRNVTSEPGQGSSGLGRPQGTVRFFSFSLQFVLPNPRTQMGLRGLYDQAREGLPRDYLTHRRLFTRESDRT